jgi:hypothetical protein
VAGVTIDRHKKLVSRVAALEKDVAAIKSKPVPKPAKCG